MSRTFFGTDGIRGPVGGRFINPTFAARSGEAAARFLGERVTGRAARVIIGRDTRDSGENLEQAVIAGLQKGGAQTISCGVVPTPAVALAVRQFPADLGIVLTASHNPASDNGIKFFSPEGRKLTDEEEIALEDWIERCTEPATEPTEAPQCWDARAKYITSAVEMLPAEALDGWKIAVDTANGATYQTTPEVLDQLGADVVAIGAEPDGQNINAGLGSEHPEALCKHVLDTGARLGIAHDGDGDRLVICDEKGQLLDGDVLLGLLALHELKRGTLAEQRLVVTVMSNLGLDRAVEAAGGTVARTPVGDRHVMEEMLRSGSSLGGESSGHIIVGDRTTTGDGLLAALKLIELLLDSGEPLSALSGQVPLFPQKKLNLKVAEKLPLESLLTLQEAVTTLDNELGQQGRILVRYSGTEPKIRLLAEAETEELAASTLSHLEAAVRTDLEVEG